jgi:PilZ domain-containing protein
MRRAPSRNQTHGHAGIKLRRSIPSRLTRFRAQRQASRMPLNCPVNYSGINVQGEGVLRNLSLGGGQIEIDGSVDMRPGAKLSLVLPFPNPFSPLVVDRTVVVWSGGNRFGFQHELLLPRERTQVERLLDGSDARSQRPSHRATSLST